MLDWTLMEPRAEYEVRRERAEQTRQHLEKISSTIGYLRLLTVASFVILCWLAFRSHLVARWTPLAPVAVFATLVLWHRTVLESERRSKRQIAYYNKGLSRVRDEWIGQGDCGDQFRITEHPYADDLDILGHGSIFQLLCRARTPLGKATLAGWLLRPAQFEEAAARQNAARELVSKLDLLEDMALAGSDEPQQIKPERVLAWATAPAVSLPKWLRPAALVLSIAGTASLIAAFSQILPLSAFAVMLAFEALLIFSYRKKIHAIVESAEASASDVRTLSLLVARMEREQFQSPWLARVRGALSVQGVPASRRIAGFSRRLEILESGEHMLLRILNPVLLWREQTALAVEAWRKQHGLALATWLQAVAEFEAMMSLAVLTFERPSWCFPSFLSARAAQFSAAQLRHPLLPARRAIANDVVLGEDAVLLIVSGSNMSGKSTLLRSVGLAAVLAWAGAPVPAADLSISRLQAGASLRSNDSLQDNRSRFFAEITRIRQIVDLTRDSTPVLFLLDELLSGTNSHDRRLGAAAILKGLLATGAIGLITTHDLALTGISDELASASQNVHFEDRFENGELLFDYKLKPGVVTRSNALALMRAVGLEV